MGEHLRPLEQLIENQRHELGENMELLAAKARAVTDWRAQVGARPFPALGVAATAGVIVALLTTGRRHTRTVRGLLPRTDPSPPSPFRGLARDARAVMRATAVTAILGLLKERARPRTHPRRPRHVLPDDAPTSEDVVGVPVGAFSG